MARRRRRWLGLLAVVVLPLLVVRVRHRGPQPETFPWEGALPVAADPVAAPRPGEDSDGDGLEDVLEARVARRHAPRYRFAAADPAGPDCPQNRDERHFPMSVARFLACLDAGLFELHDRARVRSARPGRFEERLLVGYPAGVVGDPPGEAPAYTHVYPGEEPGIVYCEYWLWFGHDQADAAFLGIPVPFGGHRGDWEHSAYRVALDPPRLLEGYYYGHARCIVVAEDELQRVAGEHPLVYVSQGKHASYPAACRLPTVPAAPGWLIQHIDFANGRGVVWDAWEGRLVDLGERERPSPAAARWLGFRGRWGQDLTEIAVLGVGRWRLGDSPTGPGAKSSWGNNGRGTPWSELRRRPRTVLLEAPR